MGGQNAITVPISLRVRSNQMHLFSTSRLAAPVVTSPLQLEKRREEQTLPTWRTFTFSCGCSENPGSMILRNPELGTDNTAF